jgi:hypothetical protein
LIYFYYTHHTTAKLAPAVIVNVTPLAIVKGPAATPFVFAATVTLVFNSCSCTLTMTGAVASSDNFYVVYIGKALQTVVPPANSITAAMMTGAAGVGSFLGDTGTALGNIIRVHEQELNTSVTVAANTNGVAAGPLTIASGVTLTITAGASLAVV